MSTEENSDSEAPSWVLENSEGSDYSLHVLEDWSPEIEVSGGNQTSVMDDALKRLELRIKVEQERKFHSKYKTMFYLDRWSVYLSKVLQTKSDWLLTAISAYNSKEKFRKPPPSFMSTQFLYEMLDCCRSDTEIEELAETIAKAVDRKPFTAQEWEEFYEALPIDFMVRSLGDVATANWEENSAMIVKILEALLEVCPMETIDGRFKPFVEPLYRYILGRSDWVISELIVCLRAFKFLLIYADSTWIERFNDTLDVISVQIKNEHRKLDSLSLKILLEMAIELMQFMRENIGIMHYKPFMLRKWPVNFRKVVKHLLQVRAISYGVPSTPVYTSGATYLPLLFKLSVEVVLLVDYWLFEDDVRCLLLLASLSSLQLSYIFNEDSQVNTEDAFIHGRLHCEFMRCGEESYFLTNEEAGMLSKIMHNSACYTCDYFLKHNDVQGKTQEVVIAVYEFLCIYINFGGLETLSSNLTKNLGPTLVSLCANCCETSTDIVEFFVLVIDRLHDLPNTTLNVILKLLEFMYTREDNDNMNKVAEAVIAVIKCTPCNSWYTAESLAEAKKFFSKINIKIEDDNDEPELMGTDFAVVLDQIELTLGLRAC